MVTVLATPVVTSHTLETPVLCGHCLHFPLGLSSTHGWGEAVCGTELGERLWKVPKTIEEPTVAQTTNICYPCQCLDSQDVQLQTTFFICPFRVFPTGSWDLGQGPPKADCSPRCRSVDEVQTGGH